MVLIISDKMKKRQYRSAGGGYKCFKEKAGALLCLLLACAAAQRGGAQTPDRAVLIRGNERVTGIPGLGENAFAALYGEYALEREAAAPRAEAGQHDAARFSVWLFSVPLVLPGGDWKPWPEDRGLRASQKSEADALLLAMLVEDPGPRGGFRGLLFRFPQEAQGALGTGSLSRLIRAWVHRFRYFLAPGVGENQISFPGVLKF